MDQNFQTSFIPKKPIVEEAKKSSPSFSVGLFTMLSLFVFFTVAVGSGGLYFYKATRQAKLKSMITDLNLSQKSFEPSKIAELQTLDKRLSSAKQVLSNHVAITPIFKALESLTMKAVRYSKFSYSFDGSVVNVKMSGQAIGYRSIALQADLLSKSKYFIDPVFSNLNLDPKGNVLFDLNFAVAKNFIDYSQMLKTEKESTASQTLSTDGTASPNQIN